MELLNDEFIRSSPGLSVMTDIVTDALEVISQGGLESVSDSDDEYSLDSDSRASDSKAGGGLFEESDDDDSGDDTDGDAATLKRVRTRVEQPMRVNETLELGTIILDDVEGYRVRNLESSSQTRREEEHTANSSIPFSSDRRRSVDEDGDFSTLKSGDFRTAAAAHSTVSQEDRKSDSQEATDLIRNRENRRQKRASTSEDSDSIDERVYSEEDYDDEKKPEGARVPVAETGHKIVYQRSTEKKKPSRIELDRRVLAIPTSPEPSVLAATIRREPGPAIGARKHSLSTVDDLKGQNMPTHRKASLESTLSVRVSRL
jgi:hypothetical protein